MTRTTQARQECRFKLTASRRFAASSPGSPEYAFHARLGVADPPLVDYIAELLVRFVRSDDLYPDQPRFHGRVQVTDMLAEAQHRGRRPRARSRFIATWATSRCSLDRRAPRSRRPAARGNQTRSSTIRHKATPRVLGAREHDSCGTRNPARRRAETPPQSDSISASTASAKSAANGNNNPATVLADRLRCKQLLAGERVHERRLADAGGPSSAIVRPGSRWARIRSRPSPVRLEIAWTGTPKAIASTSSTRSS